MQQNFPRLSVDETIDLIENLPLYEIGKMAYKRKKELHSDNITTFVIDRNINYTNICFVECDFCAFCRRANDKDAYILTYDEIDKKIDELIDAGGSEILFQGGVHPQLKIDFYENLVEHIHTKYPNIDIHGFSAIEIDYIAKISKISTYEVLTRLKNKGLYSIPGAGAEILSDRVRDIVAPKKIDSNAWLKVHEKAHKIGIKSTATQMFGMIETTREIVEHWEQIRALQDQTGGFRAFILWSFQSKNTRLIAKHPEIMIQSSNRYLRLLAASRLFLDNFKNIQSSWVTQGAYVGGLALKFGANDMGSTMMEENVVGATGVKFRMNSHELIELIKNMGEIPAKRNTNYDILEIYH